MENGGERGIRRNAVHMCSVTVGAARQFDCMVIIVDTSGSGYPVESGQIRRYSAEIHL
jgi:hypothetical protein